MTIDERIEEISTMSVRHSQEEMHKLIDEVIHAIAFYSGIPVKDLNGWVDKGRREGANK